ncbi:YsnF/AvaK domain-containing protein [Kocuria sp.]|uniref:YsnF/AvaK domain-containing protein n=1 Tax=Kocuria sp. TaxID=1871328 RepID=UPI0028126CE1|nr:YsnF/AvaK domain-containing protein [Kocuria sp.]
MSTSDERTFAPDSPAGRPGRSAQDDSGVELHPPSSSTELWDHNAYGRENGDIGGSATTGATDTRDPRGGAPAYNIDAGDDDADRHGDDAGRNAGPGVRATGESLTGADATAGDRHESVGEERGRHAADEPAAAATTTGTGERAVEQEPVTGRHSADGPVGEPSAPGGADAGAGLARDDGGASVVRHEERLRVGTEQVESGRVRLRKYVVEEPARAEQTLVSEDVEEVRTPITDEERQAFLDGQELPLGEDEVILYRDVPVVQTVRVPYERVRLVVRRTERTEVVEDTVRQERVDVEEV